jgi:hypothetical protein
MMCLRAFNQVVDNDGLHGMVKRSGNTILSAGQHVGFPNYCICFILFFLAEFFITLMLLSESSC